MGWGTSGMGSPEQAQARSSTFMLNAMGSTASATPTGCTACAAKGVSEVKTLALPSLPKRMTRLSKTASPVTVASPGKASPVTR